MSTPQWPYRLLAPGPVPVPPEVLRAMSAKVIHHRTPEFEQILRDCWQGLQWAFNTQQDVMIVPGTGSAAMEAAVVNTLSPGDEALVIVSGKFGERWAEQCERFGVKTHRWNIPWGSPADLPTLEQKLKELPRVAMVFSQVCETSTATVHPIRAMSALIKQNSRALFAVDAITAAGCMELPMDAWGIDVVVAGSQKAFMIPTGISFIAMSKAAWARQQASTMPRHYFDLMSERRANARGETTFSSPTSLIVALQHVLRRWQEKGFEQVFRRCQLLAEVTRSMAQPLGLKVYSQAPSSSVTALEVPEGVDSTQVRNWLERERNITIMGGQDQLKGKILRIGHMGDVHDDDMVALARALGEHFKRDVEDLIPKMRDQLGAVRPLFE